MSIFDKRINILPIKGYDFNYLIDTKGNLYKDDKKLIGGISKQGYLRYGLKINGKWIKEYAHRLVAKTFIKNDNFSKTIINHIDGNKLNNNVSNLEWCTYYENNNHAILNNLNNISGENHFNHKLKDFEILNIRELYSKEYNITKLSKIYNVSIAQISRIINYKRRKDVNI